MNPRLILIDGLPGSGKTTTARILAETLTARGLPVQCLLEYTENGEQHPLNVGGALHPAGQTTGEELFSRYSVESYIEESMRRWHAFVQSAVAAQTIWIVESYPFQNSIRILLQMDASEEAIQTYAGTIEECMRPLHPVLLFFEQTDAERQTRAAVALRGEQWATYMVELVTRAPYARKRGLQGYDAVIQCMQAYNAAVTTLRRRSQLPELVLQGGAGRWEDCLQQILKFLDTAHLLG